jgi:4-diphosphocytidyl-2-methyl-D-erithritol synthase
LASPTPQSFQKIIHKRFKKLCKGFIGYRRIYVNEEAGFSVIPVYGSSLNFKVTAPQDWEQARRLVK